jgi:hypothetical protein
MLAPRGCGDAMSEVSQYLSQALPRRFPTLLMLSELDAVDPACEREIDSFEILGSRRRPRREQKM